MFNIKGFYPTPDSLIEKMWNKIDTKMNINFILEPSAGKGNIIDWIKENNKWYRYKISAIEKDNILRQTLLGKNINVIDSDFLLYSSPDKYDLIIMNPPFKNGIDHLNKAIDILYSGQIVCLLNANNIKNANSNKELALVKRLNELNANIEYIENAFVDSERKTNVEIALIYIKINKEIDKELFSGLNLAEDIKIDDVKEQFDITIPESIENIVKDFQQKQNLGIQTIINFYRNIKVSKYFNLKINNIDEPSYSNCTLTDIIKIKVNQFLEILRKEYWTEILNFKDIQKNLTEKKYDEFMITFNQNSNLDFTVYNIKQFIKNLILSYDKTLINACIEIFDTLTYKYAYDETIHNKSVHYFDGWKTNNAYKLNKKVIYPTYGKSWFEWNTWWVPHNHRGKFNDLDKVCNYFDNNTEYISIVDACEKALKNKQTSNIESTYFFITIYKKGTVHLTFKDDNILRKFNITVCKGKNWLPHDYASKKYEDCNDEEQKTIKTFENNDIKKYNNNLCAGTLFSNKNLLKLEKI